MSIIPDFLLKRIYRKGSLRETAEGIAFDLKNILGPGIITGINYIIINDEVYQSPLIKIVLKEGINKIIVELISRDVGKVQVTLTDTV